MHLKLMIMLKQIFQISFLLNSVVVFSQESNLNKNISTSLRCQNPMVFDYDTIQVDNVTWERTLNPKYYPLLDNSNSEKLSTERIMNRASSEEEKNK